MRRRVTRTYDLIFTDKGKSSELTALAVLAWGTADATFPECLLIKQDVTGQEKNKTDEPLKEPGQLVRVYEQIHPSNETQVGNLEVDVGQDGLVTIVQNLLQFSTGTAFYGTAGSTVAPSPWGAAILKLDERTDDGTLRRIKRTYITAGQIDQSDELKNNNKLLLRTLTYVNQVPPTPSGFILISKKVQYVNGLPIYSYTFAQGNGQISTSTEYRLSPDQGATGITITTIKYLTDPSVNTNPTTGPVGSNLTDISYEEGDGYRIWSADYGQGQGTISLEHEYLNNGKLVRYKKTEINSAPSAPAPTIGGTVVLISATQRNGTRFENGTIVFDSTWAEGLGLVEQKITVRSDGTREQTYVSLGTRQAPASGSIVLDESEELSGVTKYTVTAMQSAAGGAVTGATAVVNRFVPFKYPGRAKPYKYTGTNGFIILDIYLDPPIETEITATVTTTYQTSNTLSLPFTRWQPLQGATVQAEWVGLSNVPGFHLQALREYRSVLLTPVSFTASAWGGGVAGTCLGNQVFGGATAIISVVGGPSDPGGSTWTLDAKIELAFIDTSGTPIYRCIITTAAVPSQPALPV